MKNIHIILSLLVILAIGVGVGYRIEVMQIAKDENKTKGNSLDAQPLLPTKINFISPRTMSGEVANEGLKLEIEKLMNSKNIQFSFRTGSKNPGKPAAGAAEVPDKINMGAIEPSRVVEMRESGAKIDAIYTVSLNPDQECFSEIQIVSNGNIEKLEDLNGKNIGVEALAMPLSILSFKKLKEKNISFAKLNLYQNDSSKSSLADLIANKIEALVVKTRSQSSASNQPWSSIGVFQGTSYQEYPKFKILTTSDNKVPCRVIFINSLLPAVVKEEISNKLESLLSKTETKEVFSKGIHIASLRKMTPKTWKAVEELLKSSRNIPLSNFASEVIKNNN